MTTLQALAARVAQGGLLREEEADVVVSSHDLITIGMMADDVRRRLHGLKTTFLRVLEIHVDAVPSTVPSIASAGEVRLVGQPASIEQACGAVEQTRQLLRDVILTGFSLAGVARLEASSEEGFARLRDAGLDGLAEAPADGLVAASVHAARAAGLRVERLTVHARPHDPVALINLAQRAQATVGGFRVFAPLPRTISVAAPTTGYDDIKLVALARLLIHDIPSIQVDWPLYGPKLAQVALTVGADDVDGIAAVDPATLGTRRSALEEIKGNIRAAGLEPIERNGRFEVHAS